MIVAITAVAAIVIANTTTDSLIVASIIATVLPILATIVLILRSKSCLGISEADKYQDFGQIKGYN